MLQDGMPGGSRALLDSRHMQRSPGCCVASGTNAIAAATANACVICGAP